jgi:hypothetical protein
MRSWLSESASRRMIAEVAAVQNAVSAAPASASLIGVAPARPDEAIEYTSTVAIPAPTKANHTWPLAGTKPNRKAPPTTATAAPALMPSTPGSASGLRATPCRIAPPSASAAPTRIASRVRGSRISRMTAASAEPSPESSTPNTVAGVTSRDPSARLSTATTTSTPAATTRPPASPAACRRVAGAASVGFGRVSVTPPRRSRRHCGSRPRGG